MDARHPKQKRHFVVLDGLRGLAQLLVVWEHTTYVFWLHSGPPHAHLRAMVRAELVA